MSRSFAWVVLLALMAVAAAPVTATHNNGDPNHCSIHQNQTSNCEFQCREGDRIYIRIVAFGSPPGSPIPSVTITGSCQGATHQLTCTNDCDSAGTTRAAAAGTGSCVSSRHWDGSFGATCSTLHTQCNNGRDDDGNGKTDHPQDPGCSSLTDDSEYTAPPPPPGPEPDCPGPVTPMPMTSIQILRLPGPTDVFESVWPGPRPQVCMGGL